MTINFGQIKAKTLLCLWRHLPFSVHTSIKKSCCLPSKCILLKHKTDKSYHSPISCREKPNSLQWPTRPCMRPSYPLYLLPAILLLGLCAPVAWLLAHCWFSISQTMVLQQPQPTIRRIPQIAPSLSQPAPCLSQWNNSSSFARKLPHLSKHGFHFTSCTEVPLISQTHPISPPWELKEYL